MKKIIVFVQHYEKIHSVCKHYEKNNSVCSASKIKKIKALTMAYENCNKASISITRVKSTKVGLEETESNKACTRSICKKFKYYEFI